MANENDPKTNPLEQATKVAGGAGPRGAAQVSNGVAEVEKRLRDNSSKAAEQRAAKTSNADPLYPSTLGPAVRK
jgi:hypothetical protein